MSLTLTLRKNQINYIHDYIAKLASEKAIKAISYKSKEELKEQLIDVVCQSMRNRAVFLH